MFIGYTTDEEKIEFIEMLGDIPLIEKGIQKANKKAGKVKKFIGNSHELANQALAMALEYKKQADSIAEVRFFFVKETNF